MSFPSSVASSFDSAPSNQTDADAVTQNLQAVNGQRGNSPRTVGGGAACTRLELDTHVSATWHELNCLLKLSSHVGQERERKLARSVKVAAGSKV